MNVSTAKSSEESSSVDARFAANGFLKVNFTLQTSRSNNKQDIGTFLPSRHNLTLKEWSKVTSDTTKDSQVIVSLRLTVHCKPLDAIISEI